MTKTAARVMTGKTLNAGQICLAPDYVMVPEGKVDDFVAQATKSVETMFPTMKENPDYTSVVNQRHYDRLQSYLDDARAKGAKIVEINPANEDFLQQPHHKIPPTIIIEPTEDMKVMQEEIFGPILPVKSYKSVDDAIGYVNDHDRPLGLYYFGDDRNEENRVINSTTSGGVAVNDVITHIMQEDAPFGGVGPSGTGSYHGKEGFINEGQEIVLPKNKPHNHYNTNDKPVEYIQTISPGMDVDLFLENLFGMINDGKVKDGKLPFLQAMVTGKYLESPSRLAAIPLGIQNVLMNVLGPIARLFGYRAIYKKYTGIEK